MFSAGQKLTASTLNASLGQQVVGGLWRITTSASTSGTTEMVWATTPSLSLAANSTYEVFSEVYVLNSAAAGDLYILRIRDTNVSGTQRAGIDAQMSSGGQGPYDFDFSYTFTTTTAGSFTFCSTIQRFSGTSTAQATAGSKLYVRLVGSNTILTTA
jgi:hypothetical protein